MSVESFDYLERANELKFQGKYEEAFQLIEAYVSNHLESIQSCRLRADIFDLMGNAEDGLEWRQKCVDLGSKEPCDYYELGIANFTFGQYELAINSFSTCEKISLNLDNKYYYEPAVFRRAVTLFKVGEYEQALEASSQVEYDDNIYINGLGLISNKELRKMILKNLNSQKSKQKIWKFD